MLELLGQQPSGLVEFLTHVNAARTDVVQQFDLAEKAGCHSMQGILWPGLVEREYIKYIYNKSR